MHTAFIAATASAVVATTAQAGFSGFVAYSRNVGANTVIDVFAAVTNASDKFLNVYDLQSNGVFVQKAGLNTKSWNPYVSQAPNPASRSVSDDSFMTAGSTMSGGEYYASANTNSDPNFTGTSWSTTLASAAATTIPSNAGWFTGNPVSADNNAELMGAWAGISFARSNSVLVSAAGGYAAPANSNAAAYGIWCSHLVVAGNNKQIGVDFTFRASASIKDGVNAATTQATYQFVPAPGAIGLLAVAGIAGGRRRRG